jgi:hypothetical protein
MVLTPNRKELLLVIYDKLIVALFVAVIAATLIYSYNVYSKAFELAQARAGGYTAIAAKLRDLVMNNSVKASQEIQAAYSRGDRFLSQEEGGSIDSLAIEIRGVSKLLGKQIGKTATLSEKLADALTEAATNFAISGAFTKRAVEDANAHIATLQAAFIDSYNGEIGPLASNEFRTFFEAFQNELPIFLRPGVLLIIAVAIFIVSTVVIWILLGLDKTVT